jgi:hypothetical protein
MKRKLYLVALAGFCLPLAGCGGSQNPLQTVHHAPLFLSGLWDGLTFLIAFVAELFDPKYGIYSVHQHSAAYNGGYVLGVCLFVLAIGGFLNRRFG